MSKKVQEVNFNDDSEFLEKDIQRRAGELAKKKQEEEFEKDSSSGKFKIISYVVETVGALFFVAYVLWDIWTSTEQSSIGRVIVIGAVVLALSTFVFRYISKYYYMKGKTKRFKFFNTVSKVSEVSISLADAVMPGGNKMVTRIERTQNAVSDAIRHADKLSALDDDNAVYKDSSYDSYRKKCYSAGLQVSYEGRVSELENSVKSKISNLKNIPCDMKRDLLMTLFILRDYRNGKCKDIIDENLYISLIGALYYFHGGKGANNFIPNFIPGIGYTDDMFMLNCVLAANVDSIKRYKGWRYMEKKKRTADLESSIISELTKVGKTCYESGNVNTIVESVSNVTELSNCVEMYKRSKQEEVSYVLLGVMYYWTCKEDIINDDIPNIGKADDMYVLNVATRYAKKAEMNLIVEKHEEETKGLDAAIDELRKGDESNGLTEINA